MREFIEADEISFVLSGFKVASIENSIMKCKEDNTTEDVILITFTNDNHVAIDMIIGSTNMIGEPYAVKDDLSRITNEETKC